MSLGINTAAIEIAKKIHQDRQTLIRKWLVETYGEIKTILEELAPEKFDVEKWTLNGYRIFTKGEFIWICDTHPSTRYKDLPSLYRPDECFSINDERQLRERLIFELSKLE